MHLTGRRHEEKQIKKRRGKMPSRIVLMTGGVETLTYFSKELGNVFEEKGYKVFYYDLKELETCFSRLKRFLKPKETVLITFNHIGLSQEDLLYRPQQGYIWEQFQIPVYNILVDHPLYYHNHLSHPIKNYHYIGIDKKHIQYVENYYLDVKVCGFLPLAGMRMPEKRPEKQPEEQPEKQPEEQKEEQKEKREIPVLFTGNYQAPEKFNTYIERIDEEYTQFYHKIIDRALAESEKTLEEVAKECCLDEMGTIYDKDFAEVLTHMNFIDLYVRNVRRGNVVRTLLDAEVSVEAVGDGWEKLESKHPELLKIHPQTDTRTCLELMQQAKISLNVMPEFKDGAHDRIFSSILNGAVSVSDDSRYLRECLPEGVGICYYDRNHLEELPEIVKHLLAVPKEREEIVLKGKAEVEKKHTWRQRAEQLIEWIEAV